MIVSERKMMKVERGEMINDHLNALSTYWDTVMKEFNRYMPLSIFDPAWLRQDISFISNKSSRAKTKDADSTAYNGSQNEVLLVMKAHFENVLEIQQENDGSWVMAYRYDLMMRQTYMV